MQGKKQKIGRKMKKIKQKSEAIFDQDGIEERQKMRQVQSVIKRTLQDKDKKKNYVVGKKFKATSFGKNSRYASNPEPTSWSTRASGRTSRARSARRSEISARGSPAACSASARTESD